MQNFDIEQTVLILNCEKKEKVNIYTLVTLGDKNETQTLVGIKQDVPLHVPLLASINIRITRESFELLNGTRKYINNTNMFITKLEEMKK